MHTRSLLATGLVCATVVAVAGFLSNAGPLDPPAGPVAPTHKTLTEVEPRIPIGPDTTPGDADSTFRITQSGSYYLTSDVNGEAGKSGIEIAAHAVTIDLAGFALRGVGDALHGITAPQQRFGVIIRNGTIWNWPGEGIDGGIDTPGLIQNGQVENIVAQFNGGVGIALGDNAVITGCSVSNSGAQGIRVLKGGTIVQCSSRANQGAGIFAENGAVIANCHAGFNAGAGIQVGDGCLINGCVARDNFSSQIILSGTGSRVESSVVEQNAPHGPAAAIAALGANNHITGNTVSVANSSNPPTSGIHAQAPGTRIKDNDVAVESTATGASGILVEADGCTVEGGSVSVAAMQGVGVNAPLGRLNIIAILIGLLTGADNSTGVLIQAPGVSVRNGGIDVLADNAIGVRAAALLPYIEQENIYVGGSGSTAILADGAASTGTYRDNAIILAGAANMGIDLASGGGHSVHGNSIQATGSDAIGVEIHGPRCAVLRNDIAMSGLGASRGIRDASGIDTFTHIAHNTLRLGESGAVGIDTSGSTNALVLANMVVGEGTHFDISTAQHTQEIRNPGSGFSAESTVNLGVGPFIVP